MPPTLIFIHFITSFCVCHSISYSWDESRIKSVKMRKLLLGGSMNFERIRYVREMLDLSGRQLAKEFNLTKSTISRWETGEKVIPLKHLIRLCNRAQVSIDFALGLTNNKTKIIQERKLNPKPIGKHLRLLRQQKKITQKDLSDLLNTSQSTISSYENGKTTILTAFLYSICKRYKVSADWICDNNES